MSTVVFTITFLIMIVGMLSFLIINMTKIPVVKAGKVSKKCSRNKIVLGNTSGLENVDGNSVHLSEDIPMWVCGNSMIKYGIKDGQIVYVRKFEDGESHRITTFPVLVFNIVDGISDDAKFKLRKFVGYVNSDDCLEIYQKYKNRISLTENQFLDQCTNKLAKLRNKTSEQLVLSETFDEDKKENAYSLHPLSTVYGKVEYASR